MSTLKTFADIAPVSAAGYRILEVISENRSKILSELTFDISGFLSERPEYIDAEVVKTEKERGVTTFYVRK